MKTIVVTGSTRGIGLGLAKAFLKHGCSVVLSGRTSQAVDLALSALQAEHNSQHIAGFACDVQQFEEVKGLWHFAVERFGKVDIWINNAGAATKTDPLWVLQDEQVRSAVQTNLLGTMYGAMIALEGMLVQGYGAIYNMEGAGSDGRIHPGLTVYGTTKYGLRYFTDSLVKEVRATPILISAIRPGMVITDLVTDQFEGRPEEWQRFKKILNLIAEPVETVCPWLVKRILENQRSGVRISYNNPGRMLRRAFLRWSRQEIMVE